MTLLVAAARLVLLAFLGNVSLAHDYGMATLFGYAGDSWAGRELRCTHEKLPTNQMVCAHRTLPCGTVVLVENVRTRRFAPCRVLDRGPFGATLPGGQVVLKTDRRQPGIWRGLIDLSPSVASALGFNGRERVHIFYPRTARKRIHGKPGNKAKPPLPVAFHPAPPTLSWS